MERGNGWKHLGLWLSLVVLMFLGPGGAAQGTEDPTEVIKVGFVPIADCLQLYVADEKGFFKEEGVRVEKLPLQGGSVIAAAVEAGAIHIGWSNTVSIIIAHTKGFDFTFLTAGAIEVEGGHRTHSLLVARDSPIRQVSDLAGKRVAINTLGNVNELSLRALADMHGLDGKKIQMVELPFPDMEAALKNRSVDAVVAAEPFVTLSLSHGVARALEPSAHRAFGDRFVIASWFAKESWINKNPKKAAGFATAIRKASEFITSHPEEVATVLAKNTKLTSDLIRHIALPAFSPTLDIAEIQKMIDLSARYKFIAQPFKAEVIVSSYAR